MGVEDLNQPGDGMLNQHAPNAFPDIPVVVRHFYALLVQLIMVQRLPDYRKIGDNRETPAKDTTGYARAKIGSASNNR